MAIISTPPAFCRVFYHVLMLLKEVEHRSGKQPHRQKRNDEAQRIDADQQKSPFPVRSLMTPSKEHLPAPVPHGVHAKLKVKPSTSARSGFMAS